MEFAWGFFIVLEGNLCCCVSLIISDNSCLCMDSDNASTSGGRERLSSLLIGVDVDGPIMMSGKPDVTRESLGPSMLPS